MSWDLILSTHTLLLLMAVGGSAIVPTVLLWRLSGRKMAVHQSTQRGMNRGEEDSNQCHNFHSRKL